MNFIHKYDIIMLGSRWEARNTLCVILDAQVEFQYMCVTFINKIGNKEIWRLLDIESEYVLISRID